MRYINQIQYDCRRIKTLYEKYNYDIAPIRVDSEFDKEFDERLERLRFMAIFDHKKVCQYPYNVIASINESLNPLGIPSDVINCILEMTTYGSISRHVRSTPKNNSWQRLYASYIIDKNLCTMYGIYATYFRLMS